MKILEKHRRIDVLTLNLHRIKDDYCENTFGYLSYIRTEMRKRVPLSVSLRFIADVSTSSLIFLVTVTCYLSIAEWLSLQDLFPFLVNQSVTLLSILIWTGA